MPQIDDAGGKIGGARKDWRHEAMVVDDLDDLTDDEQYQHVRKDNIWNPNWSEMVRAGTEPKAAAAVKLVRDRLAKQPKRNTRGERERFIRMMTMVRDRFMAVETVEDVRAARKKLIWEDLGDNEQLSQNGKLTQEGRALATSVFKNRREPFIVDERDLVKAKRMVAEGWPDQKRPQHRRGIQVSQDPSTKRYFAWNKTRGLISPHFDSEAELDAWLKEHFSQQKKKKRRMPSRPDPNAPQRPDRRDGCNVVGEDFVNDFGFYGVEFGHWVDHNERQELVNAAYDALVDLADVLDVPKEALSLGGTLSLAFGARGHGHAAAHYEPGRKVINLTRPRGAGSLAHEWAHALDHYVGRMGASPVQSGPQGGSGWYTQYETPGTRLPNLDREEAQAWDAVMDTARFRRKTPEEAAEPVKLRIQKIDEKIRRLQDSLEEATSESWKKAALRDIDHAKSRRESLQNRLEQLQNASSEELDRCQTEYLNQALQLSGKNGYHTRPTELFARAFECYVSDTLEAQGERDDFLVYGVAHEMYDRPELKGNPYPGGQERARLNGAIAALAETMKPRLTSEARMVRTPEQAPAEEPDVVQPKLF